MGRALSPAPSAGPVRGRSRVQPRDPGGGTAWRHERARHGSFEAFRAEFGQRFGRARRPRNTRARRYVSRQLNLAGRAAVDDLMRCGGSTCFGGFSGETCRRSRERPRRDPGPAAGGPGAADPFSRHCASVTASTRPDDSGRGEALEPEVIRIVCSDGLVE